MVGMISLGCAKNLVDAEIMLGASEIAPMVSWGTSPEQSIAVDGTVPQGPARAHDYIDLAAGTRLEGTPIDVAFIGSCTNSRLSDLRRAAALVKGRHIAPGIKTALVVPGSSAVKRAAEAEGLDDVFRAGVVLFLESFQPAKRQQRFDHRHLLGAADEASVSHIDSIDLAGDVTLDQLVRDGRALSPAAAQLRPGYALGHASDHALQA